MLAFHLVAHYRPKLLERFLSNLMQKLSDKARRISSLCEQFQFNKYSMQYGHLSSNQIIFGIVSLNREK